MVGLEFPARFESSQDTLSRRNYRTLKRQSSQKPLKPKKAIKITSRPFKQKQEDRSSGPCSVIDQVFEQEGIERDLFLELRQEVNMKKEDELRLQMLEIGKEIDEPTIQEGFSYQDFELIELDLQQGGEAAEANQVHEADAVVHQALLHVKSQEKEGAAGLEPLHAEQRPPKPHASPDGAHKVPLQLRSQEPVYSASFPQSQEARAGALPLADSGLQAQDEPEIKPRGQAPERASCAIRNDPSQKRAGSEKEAAGERNANLHFLRGSLSLNLNLTLSEELPSFLHVLQGCRFTLAATYA